MKIIASDYDGTFNHGGIDDIKRKAVSDWRKQGNLFGIVSGRGMSDLVELVAKKDFECDFLIANNGAKILRPDGEVLSDIRCSGELALPLIRFLFDNGCPYAAVNIDSSIKICSEGYEETEEAYFTLNNAPTIPYFNQISTILDNDDEAAAVTANIIKHFGGVLNPLQNGRCIDIVDKNVNKAKGIYTLIELVGADYGDVVTVGDNINDSDMIKEFCSYAMENAVDSIKKLADYRINSVTELIYKLL